VDQKNYKKDIFEAIDFISAILPKKKYLYKNTNKTNASDIIGANFVCKIDLPKFNQSAMDGIGISKVSRKYKIVGKTSLTKLNNKIITNNECLIVKTGSFINSSIKKIVPIEDLVREKNIFYQRDFSKDKFIRTKGHIIKKNSVVFKKGYELQDKDIQFIESFHNSKIKIIKPLSFSLIGTGNEFFEKKEIKPTNIAYLQNFLKKNNQTLNEIKIIKDDQQRLEKLIKQSKSNIVIVTGGTGKSDDDFHLQNKNLIINSLNLKPGKPFKVMKIKNKIIFFFPGNPCSNFVLTNILLKGLLHKYYSNKSIQLKSITIKNFKKLMVNNFPFGKLKRKSFLFANLYKNKVKIFDDQESSNILNIINSNILVYYDHSKYIKYISIND
jgi:molybdopterin molybdotransferase